MVAERLGRTMLWSNHFGSEEERLFQAGRQAFRDLAHADTSGAGLLPGLPSAAVRTTVHGDMANVTCSAWLGPEKVLGSISISSLSSSLSLSPPRPLLFETGFLCVALAILELTLQTRLASNSERLTCLCLPSPEIKGVHHHHLAWGNNFCIFSLIK